MYYDLLVYIFYIFLTFGVGGVEGRVALAWPILARPLVVIVLLRV